MKRTIMTAIMCIAALAVLLAGCGSKVLDRPPEMTGGAEGAKTLEFWVGERVEEGALEEFTLIVGMFGGFEYFGSGYCDKELFTPWEDEYPEYYVAYTLTAYPDYSSGDSDTVTRIEIFDPAVTVYGIGCNSAIEDFVEVFGDLGCQTEHTERYATATYGKTTISLTAVDGARALRIFVEVTNKTGMIF